MGRDLFKIVEADNAEDGTECLIRENNFDLVLLDIRMPEINGQVMFDVIREYSPKMKVIVASVFPIEEQKRMIPFADDYYDKSTGLIKLMEKVTRDFR